MTTESHKTKKMKRSSVITAVILLSVVVVILFFGNDKIPNKKVVVIERTTVVENYEALCTVVFQGTNDTLRGIIITEPAFLKAKVPFSTYLWSNISGDRIQLCNHE